MEYNTGALRNIEKEIMRECANKNITVHENFLNYYIRLLALDPKWGVSSSMMANRMDVQTFIKFVTSELHNQKTAAMITMRMQFYFEYNFANIPEMVKSNREEFFRKIDNLKNEILQHKSAELIEDVDYIYKKLVYFVTLASGLGNPTVDEVFKEVFAALQSILNEDELQDFLLMPRFDKEDQLFEYVNLVTGIRLFNKDCEKGGEGMENLPKLLNEGIEATHTELQSTLRSIMDTVNLLTTALDRTFVTEIDERNRHVLRWKPPETCKVSDAHYLMDYLILYRQYEIYIRNIMVEVTKAETQAIVIFEQLHEILLEVHQIVGHRIAIPVNQVFPHFLKLANVWTTLQQQAVFVAKLNQIMQNLAQYVKIADLKESFAEMLLRPGQEPMTDAQRLEESGGKIIKLEDIGDRVTSVMIYSNLNKINLEYLGFCPWKLAVSKGALIPGNSSMGVITAINMKFAFSSLEAAKAFSKYPQRYVMEVIQVARSKPQLINFLKLQEQLRLVEVVKDLVTELPPPPLTSDENFNTEIHPVEKLIDKTYSWNIWDHKRRAIQLANLTHCKTVSCQTEKTFFRFGARTQTQETRDKCEQTKKDNYTNVPKPSTFIHGLRGRKDDKQVIVDLTRPVEE